ncbi:MAG: hypothetical protein ACF8R7_07390 [Phycisphaerales bacterium JB039]
MRAIPIALLLLLGLCACDQMGAAPAPVAGGGGAGGTGGGYIDWSGVTAGDEQDAKIAAYGIVRLLDLNRFEDSGWDVLSFAPGAGPQDRVGNSFATVTVDGINYEIDESRWLALYDEVWARQAEEPTGWILRPMPDARYGDGQRSERPDLIFGFVIEDRDTKSLKVVWQRMQ